MRVLPEISGGHGQNAEGGPAWTELFDAVLAGANQDPRPMRQLRSLLDENRELRAANSGLATMLRQRSGSSTTAWSIREWIAARLDPGKQKLAQDAPGRTLSWQDVHRQDTSRLARTMHADVEHRTMAPIEGAPLHASELGWLRQNAALVHLLRNGQWQPVPASPPESWAQRLASRSTGITLVAAQRLLKTAFDTAPQPARPSLLQSPSRSEQEWARQNRPTLVGLSRGELRGIPSTPSRAWVAAFQAAVGGTMLEINAILTVVLEVASGRSSVAAPG